MRWIYSEIVQPYTALKVPYTALKVYFSLNRAGKSTFDYEVAAGRGKYLVLNEKVDKRLNFGLSQIFPGFRDHHG